MNFKKYEHKKNDDGTYDILNVPIFVLGKHRGFEYNEDWFKKVQKNHSEDEAKDYYPSIIIGHNGDNMSDEKPAKGFLQNIVLKGKQIVADLTKISKDMFDSIKNREYPHRSIEVNPKAAKITALALLGGHAPYHKLPVLEVFHDDEDHEIFSTDDNDLMGEIRDGFSTVLKVLKNIGKKQTKKDNNYTEEVEVEEKQFTQKDLDVLVLEAQKEASKTAESSYRDKFKELNGLFPEEMAENLKQKEIEAYQKSLKDSIEKLRKTEYDGLIVNPVVFDEMVAPLINGIADGEVKFAEKDPITVEKAVEDVIDNIFKRASKGELFTDLKENIHHDQRNLTRTKFEGEEVDPDAAELDEKVQKYANEHKISYEEALGIVTGEVS